MPKTELPVAYSVVFHVLNVFHVFLVSINKDSILSKF